MHIGCLATNIAARLRYKALPARLKLVASGDDKGDYMVRDASCSISSIARGNAASELVVANAMIAGSLTR